MKLPGTFNIIIIVKSQTKNNIPMITVAKLNITYKNFDNSYLVFCKFDQLTKRYQV